jgi:hypothetical protein
MPKKAIVPFTLVCIVMLLMATTNLLQAYKNGDLTATYVWPPPTNPPEFWIDEQRKLWDSFNETFEASLIDPTCAVPCWSNFAPGNTLLMEVAGLLSRGLPAGASIDDDLTAPNNVIGRDGGLISLRAYSDATQPQPLLRAYYVGIGIGRPEVPMPETLAMLPQIVKDLLPDARLSNAYNLPSVSIGRPANDRNYFIVYEYPTWSIQYVYWRVTPEINPLEACPQDLLYSINLWVYSESETSFQSLLDDIKQNYRRVPNPLLFDDDEIVPFSPMDIDSFKAAQQAGGCIAIATQ